MLVAKRPCARKRFGQAANRGSHVAKIPHIRRRGRDFEARRSIQPGPRKIAYYRFVSANWPSWPPLVNNQHGRRLRGEDGASAATHPVRRDAWLSVAFANAGVAIRPGFGDPELAAPGWLGRRVPSSSGESGKRVSLLDGGRTGEDGSINGESIWTSLGFFGFCAAAWVPANGTVLTQTVC